MNKGENYLEESYQICPDIKYQYTTKILSLLMTVRAVLSTQMKSKFFYIYSYISYLPAELRSGRKEDEINIKQRMKNKKQKQKMADDERPGYYK